MSETDEALRAHMLAIGARARAGAMSLRHAPAAQRTRALLAMAEQMRLASPDILRANALDVSAAEQVGQAASLIDRLRLDGPRLEAITAGIEAIAAAQDPLGQIQASWRQPNGLEFTRVSTPLGVIGMIFESRPNVAADAAALCLRAGNCVILRAGSDSLRSVLAITGALQAGLAQAGLERDCVQSIATGDRAAVGLMLEGLGGAIDVLIPRGGKSLIERVQREARVPVFAHLEGLCHTYIHSAADADKALTITVNAKLRRVSVCGATETLLCDAQIAPLVLPRIAGALKDGGCQLRGDAAARALFPMQAADEADWSTEYLAPILSVKIVDGLDEAIAHIARYGSGHTDAIVTEDGAAGARFCAEVDSAIVLVNASTQFADGGEFGFGAEIGIATGKLHARGPIGAQHLTSFKYIVRGNGQIRP